MAVRVVADILRPITLTLSAVCFLILCPLVILAQLIPGMALLEMASSYLPHVILLSALAAAALALLDRRIAIAAALITLLAAWPFLSFSKYQAPQGGPCSPGACLTVITANVFEQSGAMVKLNEIAERENADLIAINEPDRRLAPHAYDGLFPTYRHLRPDRATAQPQRAGNALVLLSRIPVAQAVRLAPDNTFQRDLVFADLSDAWAGIRVVIAHTMIPTSGAQIAARNELLRIAGTSALEAEGFLIMGDFNMTPWSRDFRDVPGKRAGNPRLSRTWPTFFPLMGIPIDHIMASENLELVDARVLEPIGSDHYPILARYRRADQAPSDRQRESQSPPQRQGG